MSLRGFNPTNIAGLQLWLDAADPAGTGIIPANGATLSTWVDKSGNGRNATVAPGKIAGRYSTSNRAVNFTASNTGYVTSYTANPSLETMFVVFNNPSPSSRNNTVIGGPVGARALSGGYAGGRGQVGACSYLNSGVTWAGMASMPDGTYTSGTTVIITGQVNGLTTSISQNGGTIYSNTTGSAFSNVTTYLGTDYANPTYYYIGFEMEVIFYNSLLSLSQRQQVQGYLAWKWGLQGMTTSYTLSNGVSLVTADLSTYPIDVKALQLPLAQPSDQRVVYTKAFPAYFTDAILQITPTGSETINSNALYNLSTNYALSIQASGSNWGILNRYPALLNNYTATQISSSTSVFASTNTSLIFVNLTNQRKTVVLPQISQISPNSSLSMTYTIKDINGMAAFSTLFVTTSGSDLIESYSTPILAIDDNYAAVDLVAQRQTNRWLITNYYYGNL